MLPLMSLPPSTHRLAPSILSILLLPCRYIRGLLQRVLNDDLGVSKDTVLAGEASTSASVQSCSIPVFMSFSSNMTRMGMGGRLRSRGSYKYMVVLCFEPTSLLNYFTHNFPLYHSKPLICSIWGREMGFSLCSKPTKPIHPQCSPGMHAGLPMLTSL